MWDIVFSGILLFVVIAAAWALFHFNLWLLHRFVSPKSRFVTARKSRLTAGILAAVELIGLVAAFYTAPQVSSPPPLSRDLGPISAPPLPPLADLPQVGRPRRYLGRPPWPTLDFPSLSPPATAADLVREQIAQAVPGLIAFNPPKSMVQGASQRMTVRISRDQTEKAIKTGLQGLSTPEIENIQVGMFMRARLFGDGFSVTTHSDESQTVPDNGFAEWIYDVLPTRSGELTLTLAVAIRYKLPGKDEITDLPVLTRQISVEVDHWWTIKRFIVDNWKYFLSGIGLVVMGIGGYLLKRWWERGKKPYNENS